MRRQAYTIKKSNLIIFFVMAMLTWASACSRGEAPVSERAELEGPSGGRPAEPAATSDESSGEAKSEAPPAAPPAAAAPEAEPAAMDAPAAAGKAEEGGDGAAAPSRERAAGGEEMAKSERRMDAPKPEPRPPREEQGRPAAGKLTAGSWRDLDHWDFWAQLMDPGQNGSLHAQNAQLWGFNTLGLVRVEVQTPSGPALDVPVQLLNAQQQVVWQARTDKKGRASLFAGMYRQEEGPFVVVAGQGGQTRTFNVQRPDPMETIRLNLESAPAPSNTLDVMFVVDTTGSMGDELEYLKSELESVITRVQQQQGQQLRVRTSVNFYRDTTDDYTVRPYPFTDDLSTTLQAIRAQQAGGGGDFPEAVDAALADAVGQHAWSPSARARVLFLVLDAPPHSDPRSVRQMQEVTQQAAAQGIRVIPVVGSGIDKPTEFLMRFLSIGTHGDYIFLTSHSGIGGSHVKPTIGAHTVEHLNDLLVRVIQEQL